jgi:LmbE family N-acetylglucosaminyl deacetylase
MTEHVRFTLQLLLSLCLFLNNSHAQGPQKPNSAEVLADIKKLNVLGSVLYVAAHPDDENTRLITYLSKEKNYEVTYISLTRGDGGQNLIGTELRELLGVLRSEELLMARKIDGGNQLFSRANDFGYSKTPAETFRIWNKDQVMEDLMLAIRSEQPDVIINRFSHEDKFSTHGHHTASAMLSYEAFDLANDAKTYPAQAKKFGTWQPKRMFFNTSWFFYGSREQFDKMDESNLYQVDIGTYLPLLGKSVSEIAAEARSQHKCQGFGMLSARGTSMDYLDHIKGSKPENRNDIFDGINTSWSRVEGGAAIGALLSKVESLYNPQKPEASVPDLLAAMRMMEELPDGYWKRTKLKAIKKVIQACLGLYIETSATETLVAHGDSLSLHFEAVNRSSADLKLVSVINASGFERQVNASIKANELFQINEKVKIPAELPITAPYWLTETWSTGMYSVPNEALRCLPETPRALVTTWVFDLNGQKITIEQPVFYKKGEPAIGEVFEPIEIMPPVFVAFEKQALYSTARSEKIRVNLTSGKQNAEGTVRLVVPENWQVNPKQHQFQIAQKGGVAEFVFEVTPPKGAQSTRLKAEASMGGKVYTQSRTEIRYDHIPTQQVLLPSELVFTPLQVQCTAKKIGYVMGAGDEVPNALEQMGCQVTLLKPEQLDAKKLAAFDCILVGIRAYNTQDALKYGNAALLEYVKNGGVLIVQYNTTGELVLPEFAPYTLKLGRDRITEEDAKITLLNPQHRLLNVPNKITTADFDGWVQERGLYFPKEWAPEFTPLLSGKDSGETNELKGSLLVADYGKGKYIYTGLSFFRELPVGVPGPMRLLANLMSSGKK